MQTYEIREEGNTFARIEAASAEEALRKALVEYPRRSVDYHLEGDATCTVTWRAFGDEDDARAQVPVPSEGIEGIEVEAVA